tara:strand:+ start:427 stop:981 length:555 start_codon:yes stop_codon:yes gene_type:complete
MKDLTQHLMNDPFLGSSIPGQSLTSTPGTMPYENPSLTSSPFDAYIALKAGMYQRDTQKDIAEMVLAGLTCETIATSFVMIGFSKGMFNPDVAELIKPFLAVEVFKIAKRHNVKNVVLSNPVRPQDSGDIENLRRLKEDLDPENEIVQPKLTREDMVQQEMEEEMLNSDFEESEGFMTKSKGVA